MPSCSSWASPVILVPRKVGGSPLSFVDFLCVNDQSEGDAYPLPTISEIGESLAGSTVFTTLDLNSGYWHMEINPDTQPLMVFLTYFVLFHFWFMHFGLNGTQTTFQKLMIHVQRSCLGDCCIVYLDDIIVCSKDTQTHFGDIQCLIVSSRLAYPQAEKMPLLLPRP